MALAAQQEELVAAVAALTPSVVRVLRSTERRRHRRMGEEVASGTGFVVDDRGHVVTNYHVVKEPGQITVTFADGAVVSGELVGVDPLTDLALLRVVRKGPPAVTFADSDRLRVGQFALAIGNSLGLPGSPSVSLGVVSAVGRPLPWATHVLEGLVQTDAAINPGNSGGPLADL
ncbi:MAG: trypsin-like peptidase domain-containing protein, partial [Thermoplasmata archaeon]|nr:trypsin-like peptidase domain-containing protein [Thermoplasmata archaeon]